MKAILVSRTPEQLETLRHVVQAEGHDVADARLRPDGEALGPLLRDIHGDVVIVEGDCKASTDLASIERLTTEHPSLLVFLMCSRRDPDGLVAAMRSGVHEVLHCPADPTEITAALHRAARRRQVAHRTAAQGSMVAFIACKGGSGATLVATNIAYLLATEFDKKVALVDLDMEYGDATSFVTDQRPKASVADLCRQVGRLDAKLLTASMIAAAPGLWVLPAPDEPETAMAVTAAQIERVLEVAREAFDVVVIDLGRTFDGVQVKALDKADTIFAVMEDLVPSIRDAKRLLRTFASLGYPPDKVELVVNRYDRRSRIPLADIEAAVGAAVKHTIPNSFEEVAEAINLGLPLVKVAPRNPVVAAMRELAAKLVGAVPARNWLERLVAH